LGGVTKILTVGDDESSITRTAKLTIKGILDA